jgi:hypothetical protein
MYPAEEIERRGGERMIEIQIAICKFDERMRKEAS